MKDIAITEGIATFEAPVSGGVVTVALTGNRAEVVDDTTMMLHTEFGSYFISIDHYTINGQAFGEVGAMVDYVLTL